MIERSYTAILPACLILFSAQAFAADSSFNGRWNLEVQESVRPVAWWLEVQGAGGPKPTGKFMGAPGGQVDTITELTVKDGQLRFVIEKPRRDQGPYRGVGTARLVGGVLEGSFAGPRQQEVRWRGRRAPEINESDDGSWVEEKPVALFDGKTTNGWRSLDPRRPLGWSVTDGILHNNGKASNMISDRTFWNFAMRVIFRVQKGSNSGIGLRGRYEVQIWDDYGRPLDGHSMGTLYGRILPTVHASKPAGEWQTYDIRLVGREVTITLNGAKVIDRKIIEGPTAVSIDPHEDKPGPILIQGDHGMSEFREITVTPLRRR